MTKIQWTEDTWNPVIGCTPVSEGCRNCYAAGDALRMGYNPRTAYYEGIATRTATGRAVFTGLVKCLEDRLDQPSKWRDPRLVFVNSMSDLFHRDVPGSFIRRVFDTMAECPRHTFQVLTKRPERMLELLSAHTPLPNVWIGVSAEDQGAADHRIPLLLRTPAAVRFVSAEPLIGPVDLTPYLGGLGWVIVGGESGSRARPCDPAWLRNVVRQCAGAAVPCFVKQVGTRPVGIRVTDPKGGDPTEWPEDLRVREWPEATAVKGEQLCLI